MKLKTLKTKSRAYAQTARAQSAEATAQRIQDSFLARFMTQWFDEITLDRVAEDAGVTVQTIVRRFGGKEGLLDAAIKIMGEKITANRQAPSGDLGLLMGKLVEDYELTGDTVLRLLALEPRHANLKPFLDFGRGEHRRWVNTAFASQLEALGTADRRRAVDMLVIATDVYTWKLLRRDMGHSVGETIGTMKNFVSNTVAAFSKKASPL